LFAALLRVLSKAFDYTGKVLVDFYDIAIFGPLWLESMFTSSKSAKPAKPAKPAKSGKSGGSNLPFVGNAPGEPSAVKEATP
jgi:hypothetical protein